MPNVNGVQAYVAKCYKRQAEARQKLIFEVQEGIRTIAEVGWCETNVAFVVARIEGRIRTLEQESCDLGSMRRLLGDLKAIQREPSA